MRIIVGTHKIRIPTDHAYAQTILALAKLYKDTPKAPDPPNRNDIEQLWRIIRDKHQALLTAIAKHPGLTQRELEDSLQTDWLGLRGIHNGLARICETQALDKPIRVVGYSKRNRSYHMDPDVRATILSLGRR